MSTLGELARRAGITIESGDAPVRPAPRWMAGLWHRDVVAMTLPTGVYVRQSTLAAVESGSTPLLVAHESVHVEQWQRLGVTRFLISYVGDYVRARLAGAPHPVAYRSIRLERDAERRADRIANP